MKIWRCKSRRPIPRIKKSDPDHCGIFGKYLRRRKIVRQKSAFPNKFRSKIRAILPNRGNRPIPHRQQPLFFAGFRLPPNCRNLYAAAYLLLFQNQYAFQIFCINTDMTIIFTQAILCLLQIRICFCAGIILMKSKAPGTATLTGFPTHACLMRLMKSCLL